MSANASSTTASADEKEKVDYLEQDVPIPGQNYVCLSFVSPENVLKVKEHYFIKQFWHNITKAGLDLNKVTEMNELYETFLDEHQTSLEAEFEKLNDFKTTVRGLKVRGVYNTREEANVRCQVLQRMDRAHDVYVAPVGFWCPWDPSPNRIDDHEYLEPELNELMKKYKDNSTKRDMYYEEQKRERKKAALEENERKKRLLAENEGKREEDEGENENENENEDEVTNDHALETVATEAVLKTEEARGDTFGDGELSPSDILESMRGASV